jgi:tRNA-uridine 2-sulfurtransferase
VIEDFAASYVRGETPIPCVRCNETVKFRDLLETARDLGAEALVTGHYVRRLIGREGPELHRAADATRDQSYFLFATKREQLGFLRFPLGGMKKDVTRAHAERLELPVARKPDSQDICFVPTGRYAQLVEKLRPGALSPGDIVDLEGRLLGRHDGVINFTVGQRRGLRLGNGEPLYVVRLEAEMRRVVVGPKAALGTCEVALHRTNWLGAPPPRIAVKLRSAQAPAPGTLALGPEGTARVHLDAPAEAVAPGQACVAYDGDRVLGGGWIRRPAEVAAAA